MHPWLALDEELRARFIEEGRAANGVGHPGVVQVFDDDVTADGVPFLVMELLHGQTLGERWREAKRLMDSDEVARIVSGLLSVLAAAHDMGIAHCDVKPDNIFLTREGSVKLLDFGIARVRGLGPAAAIARGISGTPSYMSPEQASGRWSDVDAQSDVWAVGAVAFALLSGHAVHGTGTVQELVVRAATAEAPSVASAAPGVPPSMVRVIDRALEQDKNLRWPTARAMKVALDRACASFTPARPLRALKGRRPRGETKTGIGWSHEIGRNLHAARAG
jgi:serine/threonine-protein kinase